MQPNKYLCEECFQNIDDELKTEYIHNSEGFHRKCGGIFTTKMLHNPSNDIEAWKIDHAYPYPDKLETAYYCIKEKKLFIVGYIEICKECHYS